MIGFFPDFEYLFIWMYSIGIGMLSTSILFILNVFKNALIYYFYRKFWLIFLSMVYLVNMAQYDLWNDCVRLLMTAIFVYFVTLSPATYQHRKKMGTLRIMDTLLFVITSVFYCFIALFLIDDLSNTIRNYKPFR